MTFTQKPLRKQQQNLLVRSVLEDDNQFCAPQPAPFIPSDQYSRSSNYSLIYMFNKIIASFFGEIHPIIFGTSLSGLSWEP